uniref:Reverse transcriptase domain-containing protein n=1 Tax=Strongyloides venezuelensis TaxID=75913 RepID=A0A0K0G1B6_STRVS
MGVLEEVDDQIIFNVTIFGKKEAIIEEETDENVITLKLDCEMEKIASEKKFDLFSYKDDIVFFTKKEFEFLHLKVIEIIFQVFKQVNLKINVAYMSLNVDKIQFLNFMARVKGLAPCLKYVKAVQEVQAQVGKRSLQRFIDCEARVLAQEDEEFGNTLRPHIFFSKRLHYFSYTPSILLELRALCNS